MNHQDTNIPVQFAELVDPTVQQTTAILQISAQTCYRMIKRGELDSYLVGTSRRIKKESVLKIRNRGES
jgi:excisionase family DNA binding protein